MYHFFVAKTFQMLSFCFIKGITVVYSILLSNSASEHLAVSGCNLLLTDGHLLSPASGNHHSTLKFYRIDVFTFHIYVRPCSTFFFPVSHFTYCTGLLIHPKCMES